MKAKLRQKAIKLRTKDRLSYSEIQKRLDVPKSTLSYWLREHPLDEAEIVKLRHRAWLKGEVSRERFRNAMQKKREQLEREVYRQQRKRLINIKRESFFIAGLMLYLGEGDKKNRVRVGLANTDPAVIQFFVKWLKDFLGVDKHRIRAELHLYENMDIEAEKLFWEKTTGLSKKQFYKTQIRKLREGSFTYQESQRHGTCSIIFTNVEKKREITMAIKAFLDLYQKTRV